MSADQDEASEVSFGDLAAAAQPECCICHRRAEVLLVGVVNGRLRWEGDATCLDCLSQPLVKDMMRDTLDEEPST